MKENIKKEVDIDELLIKLNEQSQLLKDTHDTIIKLISENENKNNEEGEEECSLFKVNDRFIKDDIILHIIRCRGKIYDVTCDTVNKAYGIIEIHESVLLDSVKIN